MINEVLIVKLIARLRSKCGAVPKPESVPGQFGVSSAVLGLGLRMSRGWPSQLRST